MLKKLTLENFRSHLNSEIEFSKNITAIIGDPQSGKTNILRAIEFLRTNRPRGNPFIPRFLRNKKGKNPTVIIETDKDTISIKKEKTKSIYRINNEEPLSAGQKVPQEIFNILNLGDINVHNQTQKPFIITDSPGEVIKTINKITKLEKVDEWLKTITSKVNKKNTEISVYEKEIEEKEIKLDKLKNIERIKIFVNKIEDVKEKNELLKNKEYYINKHLDHYIILKDNNNKISSILNPVESLLSEITQIDINLNGKIEIENLLENYIEFENENNKISSILNPVEIIISEITQIDINLNGKIEIENLLENLIENENENNKIERSLKPVENLIFKIDGLRVQIAKLRDLYNCVYQYINLLKKQQEMSNSLSEAEYKLKVELKGVDICEFCNTELTEGKINEIIESI